MANKINWIQAEKDYINDCTLSYKDIAERYSISKKQVGIHAKSREWTKRRQRVHEKALNKFLKEQSNHVAKVNKQHLQYNQCALNIVSTRIKQLQDMSVNELSNISGNELLQLSKSLKMLIDMEREILGIDDATRVENATQQATWTDLLAEAYSVAGNEKIVN